MAKTSKNQSTVSVKDASFNAALDHGAVVGAQARVIARASVQQLKRGSDVGVGYTTGFLTGLKAGWNSVAAQQ